MALGKNLKKRVPEGDEHLNTSSSTEKAKVQEKNTSLSDRQDNEQVSQKNIVKSNRKRTPRRKKGFVEVQEKKLSLVVFPVGKEEYALPIAQVKEIVSLPPIAKVPQGPSYVRGLANIRGDVYAVWDLGALFYTDDQHLSAPDDHEYSVVVQLDEFFVALTTPVMPSTLVVKASEVETTSHILKHSDRHDKYISGVVRKEERLIILIDIFDLIKSTYQVDE